MEEKINEMETYVSRIKKILEDKDNLTHPDVLNLMVYSQAIITRCHNILDGVKEFKFY